VRQERKRKESVVSCPVMRSAAVKVIPRVRRLSFTGMSLRVMVLVLNLTDASFFWSVCKVRTQDPENFDEEVKTLGTAC
jgi:hypothetical protein